jgi:hypothetical protein
MSFRGDLDAARARRETLEREVDRLARSNAASKDELESVRRDLDVAKREVRRLSALEPGSPARRATPYRNVLFVTLGLVMATAVAGYHSETTGMAMSYLAAASLGFGLAGWIGSRRSPAAGIVSALAGALVCSIALAAFYEGIWPSL